MKVALVVPGGVDRSGTERVIPCLLWLIERLAARAEVHVFALQQEPRAGTWPLLGAQVHNAGSRPRRLRSLAQLLAEHRRGAFNIVHAFWAGGPGVVAAAFRRMTRTPMVLTLPGGDLAAIPDIRYGGGLSRRGRAWTRLAISSADRVLVPSDWMRKQAAEQGVAAIRVPLGVALDRWPPAAPRPRKPNGQLGLLHVANLNAVKDQETLLVATRLLADRGLDFRLDAIGLDTLDGAVQRRAAELGVAHRVHFHGFLPHGLLRTWVERSDLMVVSSRHEGVPIAALEAAVAGVPTVGTCVGQIADWAPQASVAVPVRDSAALADSILALAQNDEERLLLAHAAQELAVAEDADFTAERTLDLYRDLCRRR